MNDNNCMNKETQNNKSKYEMAESVVVDSSSSRQ